MPLLLLPLLLLLLLSLLLLCRCPNQAACYHDVIELAARNPYNPNITRVASWFEYTDIQCTKNSGYTGMLCASCRQGFGQTDAYTCDTCLGVSVGGQGVKGRVDHRLIWLLLFVYGAVFAVFMSFTIEWGVQESHNQELDDNNNNEIHVTDVVKALTMYAKVSIPDVAFAF
jgi:hypothetical protein